MDAITLLQNISSTLFIVIFVQVTLTAIRSPRRANVDTAIFFGALALVIGEGYLVRAARLTPNRAMTDAAESLFMALPFLQLRLVEDITLVDRWLMRAAAGLLPLVIVSLAIKPPSIVVVPLLIFYLIYFVGLSGYAALVIIGAARRSRGLTRRRLHAVALGSLALAFAILSFAAEMSTETKALWAVLIQIFSLSAGTLYFIGFSPPRWLRASWQVPDVRTFFESAARLSSLPSVAETVAELEVRAAATIGSVNATIVLWEREQNHLYFVHDGVEGVRTVNEAASGRAFTEQRPIFYSDATRDDPTFAPLYRQAGANAVMAVPMTAAGERLGVLTIYGERASLFAEDDLELVQLLANHCTLTIQHQRLIAETAATRARGETLRLKEDFLAGAAHDLKTPLTALLGRAQLLQRRVHAAPEKPVDPENVDRLVNEVQRLRALVLDLLDVTRIEEEAALHRETLDLTHLVEEVCKSQAVGRHRTVVEHEGSVVGLFDAGLISRLVGNLIENAVKYDPSGDKIAVKVWDDDDGAHLTVTDHGIGIPAGDLDAIFGRFQRATNVDSHRFGGMGLGLYICYRIVEQHDGIMWASSEGLGRGSTFHVRLPLDQRSLDPVSPAAFAAH